MARLFVDMDGTLAVFQPVDKLETLYEKGYFLNLAPHERVVDAVKNIIQTRSDIEVFILSAVLTDSKFALEEKKAWVNKYLPEIPPERCIFPPCGTDKKWHIPTGIKSDDFLLDDYTRNLTLWQPPARGIKLLNGINHTTGSWKHDRIRYDKPATEIAENITAIMSGEKEVYDSRPARLSALTEDEMMVQNVIEIGAVMDSAKIWEDYTNIEEQYPARGETETSFFEAREYSVGLLDGYRLIMHELADIPKTDDGEAADFGEDIEMLYFIEDKNGHRDALTHEETEAKKVFLEKHNFGKEQKKQQEEPEKEQDYER